jgi:hypothetical protein
MSEPWERLPDVEPATAATDDWEKLPDVAAAAAATNEGPVVGDPRSKTGATLQGVGQGASFGFADELAGAAASGASLLSQGAEAAGKTGPGRAVLRLIYPWAKTMPDAQLDAIMGRLSKESREAVLGGDTPGEAYGGQRNFMRGADKQAGAAHPGWHFAGNVAGGAMVPMPGGATIGAARSGLAKAGLRAAQGAGSSAVYGVGASESSSPGGTALDALKAASIGGVVAPALGGLADKAPAIGAWLKERANASALKAMGLRGGIDSQLEKMGMESYDDALKFGREALDMGLIPGWGTAKDVAERASVKKKEFGAAIQKAIGDADAAGTFNFGQAKTAAEKTLDTKGLSSTAQREGTRAQQLLDDIGKEGLKASGRRQMSKLRGQAAAPDTFARANKLKSDMMAGINYANDPALRTKLEKKVAGGLRQSIEDQVGTTAGPDVADALRKANRGYGVVAETFPLAREEANRQLARQGGLDKALSSLPSLLFGGAVGAGGLFTGGTAAGLGVGSVATMLAQAARPYMPGFMAHALDSASRPVSGVLGSSATRAIGQSVSRALTPDQREEASTHAFQRNGL